MTTTPGEPGWYDHEGRRRWWTGEHWGAIAPWDAKAAPRVVRSSTSMHRLDRQYLLDPTEPVHRATRAFRATAGKSTGVAIALVMLLGPLGAHRFYVGRRHSAGAMLTLTAIGAVLYLTPIESFPPLARLDSIVRLDDVTLAILGVAVLWWLADIVRTDGFVRAANRRLLAPSGPRTYYRGWPPA